jgi:hypothetical protein
MTLYCGIDLHANNSVVAIIDDKQGQTPIISLKLAFRKIGGKI